jgi:hypothetical protein
MGKLEEACRLTGNPICRKVLRVVVENWVLVKQFEVFGWKRGTTLPNLLKIHENTLVPLQELWPKAQMPTQDPIDTVLSETVLADGRIEADATQGMSKSPRNVQEPKGVDITQGLDDGDIDVHLSGATGPSS